MKDKLCKNCVHRVEKICFLKVTHFDDGKPAPAVYVRRKGTCDEFKSKK